MSSSREIGNRKFWGLKWYLVIGLAVLIKAFSFFPAWVEKYYTYGIYPVVSKAQRFLLGWIPFSVGDLLYGLFGIFLIYKVTRFSKAVYRKTFTRQYFISRFRQVVFFTLSAYILFNLCWGLNYSRLGISRQLNVIVRKYSFGDLDTLTAILHQRLNNSARAIDTLNRPLLADKKTLFLKSADSYRAADVHYPYLHYSIPSIKPSLYTYLGQFFGFTGYYNPFSGEAQVRTNVPVFLQPFIVTHEIAHQLGYGKENEANFVAFLACRTYDDADFKYSLYYDLYSYSVHDLMKFDSSLARRYNQSLDTVVKRDNREMAEFFLKNRNFIEPVISNMYDQYLRMNNQPRGRRTYNEVVAWLIAYYKKWGKDAL